MKHVHELLENMFAEQGILMQNLSETNQSIHSHSSVFALEKEPEDLNFHSSLHL